VSVVSRDVEVPEVRPAPRLHTGSAVVAGIGALLCAAALVVGGEAAHVRFSFAYLWAFTFLWTVVLGSLFFVALHHLAHAVWSVVIRRIAELLAAPMAAVAVLFVPVVAFAYFNSHFQIFPWLDPAEVAHDHILHGKAAYLSFSFWLIRGIVFFVLWIGFAWFFVRRSLDQDHGHGGVLATQRMRAVAAPCIMVFAVTCTFAGIDWLMALEPHWFSTIFGVYVFSGMVLTSLAAITIVTVWLMRDGPLAGVVTRDHLYSLGALMFAFTCFWAYIAFSQYMLIWYANIPEETFYFAERLHGGWLAVSVVLALMRFVIPFFLLLSRRAKMNPSILFVASVLLLAGQLVDLYWLIMPQLHAQGPVLSWLELGPMLLVVGLLGVWVARFLSRYSPLAVGDPLLEESVHFHL
jgi:hypothetical protein